MLREAAGTQPRVYARYEYGQEKSESLVGELSSLSPEMEQMLTAGAGLSDKQIEETVTKLVKSGL